MESLDPIKLFFIFEGKKSIQKCLFPGEGSLRKSLVTSTLATSADCLLTVLTRAQQFMNTGYISKVPERVAVQTFNKFN